MMGRKDEQLGFSEIGVWMKRQQIERLEKSFYGALARFGSELISESSFAPMYTAGVGRPSLPPVRLAKVLLLEMYEGVSDREAEERAKFDLRWKFALDLGPEEDGFDATTLVRFRARLVANDKERVAFEAFVQAARDAGLLSRRQMLDAMAVQGAAAVKDTYQLIRGAVRKLRKKARRVPGLTSLLAGALTRDDYDEVGKADIDWNDPAARQALLQELVGDARRAVEVVRQVLGEGGGDPSVAEAADLLARVVEQDIEPAGEAEVQIRQGVAADRIVSVTDPEMRHGRKTSSGRFDGHKAHVGMDAESELITDVEAIPGNVPDRSAVPGVLERGEQMDIPQDEITADTAYGDLGTRSLCSARGIDLVAPLQRPSSVGGRFTKMEFHIDLAAKTCICPAGAMGLPRYRRDGQLYTFQFSPASCGSCPLRERCTTAAARTVDVHPDEAERQRLYREQATPEFRTRYRQRPRVERANAELARYGMHKARYVGRRKTTLQLAFTALVVNILRALRRGWLPDMAASGA
jgi:IS5 family transposase